MLQIFKTKSPNYLFSFTLSLTLSSRAKNLYNLTILTRKTDEKIFACLTSVHNMASLHVMTTVQKIHTFYEQRFFALLLLKFIMVWASNVAYVLLDTYNHHYAEMQFILSILYPCLCLGLFMSYLCDLFFIFGLSFTVINHTASFRQPDLCFCTFFRMFPKILGW